jgi:hypothetical protein
MAFALIAAMTSAYAECIIPDPTPTPLKVRAAPNGRIIAALDRRIIAALDNGQSVNVIDHADDEQLRAWIYVLDSETDKPIGWVFSKGKAR